MASFKKVHDECKRVKSGDGGGYMRGAKRQTRGNYKQLDNIVTR
jgi:hypothetical protein